MGAGGGGGGLESPPSGVSASYAACLVGSRVMSVVGNVVRDHLKTVQRIEFLPRLLEPQKQSKVVQSVRVGDTVVNNGHAERKTRGGCEAAGRRGWILGEERRTVRMRM